MSIKIKPDGKKEGLSAATLELTKAVVAAVPLLIADPSGIAAALAAAAPGFIEAASLASRKKTSLGEAAWTVLRASYAAAIARFIAQAPLSRKPAGAELKTLVAALLDRAKMLSETVPQELTLDSFYSPLKIEVFRDAAKRLPHELQPFGYSGTVGSIRTQFEQCLVEGLQDVRAADAEEFARIEALLAGPLSNAIERRRALARHHEFIIRSFTQRPVFGQEETGITLSDLYVRQRAVWNTKEAASNIDENATKNDRKNDGEFFREEAKQGKWKFTLHVADLHKTIWNWLDSRKRDDAVRVVAGGPGSGKSTFARALAVEVIDADKYDVLFIPLQEIEPTGSFESRIDNLFRTRTELGFDRAESPLSWLGQRDHPSKAAPQKPLLIICDGLDEIAPPGSLEAASVTADFIQALASWINNRNSAGLHVCAIILGRTISAQEAFRKLGIDHRSLVRVGGLLPIASTLEWKNAYRKQCALDRERLAEVDQRIIFWENWCKANGLGSIDIPEALAGNTDPAKALEELTTEPLLLYLLLWTGYLGKQWKKAAENRNFVYAEIFEQIYKRKWGNSDQRSLRPNREVGGHAHTDDLSIDDFLLLQEALGLASWATGGRTVTIEAFNAMLKEYLHSDKYDDLLDSVGSSLKSVALQSYTRSLGAENAGFEFVHKTFGEYLIARGLVRKFIEVLSRLQERATEGRCREAAILVCKIIWQGPLTVEIHRFLVDEVRIHFSDLRAARVAVDGPLAAFISWVLKNGAPVHEASNWLGAGIAYAKLDQAEQRATDVLWSTFQAIARQAFPLDKRGFPSPKSTWSAGPLQIQWPSPQSFTNLFSRLAARTLVGETKRMATFDYVDLTGQGLTDFTYGSVIFDEAEDSQRYRPLTWLNVSLRGANLEGALFYRSNLRTAALEEANLKSASLIDATFDFADLRSANLTRSRASRATFAGADLRGANLTKAHLEGAVFEGADLSGAQLGGAIFQEAADARTLTPTVFSDANLTGASFSGCDMANITEP